MTVEQIGLFVAVFGAARLVLKVLAEFCFFLAHIFGQKPGKRAKWAGMACWWTGLGLSVLGGGTSNRALAKQFVRRVRS